MVQRRSFRMVTSAFSAKAGEPTQICAFQRQEVLCICEELNSPILLVVLPGAV
jgi:hypothetical protein